MGNEAVVAMRSQGQIATGKARLETEISQRATMAAGTAAGLVDVKVVGFSPTHTAEKFVIPIAKR